jgi:NIMA-interacting peptidyl-prolyl cis-trans isomerase 1
VYRFRPAAVLSFVAAVVACQSPPAPVAPLAAATSPSQAGTDTAERSAEHAPSVPDAGISSHASAAPETPEMLADPKRKIAARHVLIQWMGTERAKESVVRSREQARRIADEVLQKARAGVDFARLALEYSDEPGAGPRGGSLGRFGRGMMAPPFEEASFALKVGEISDVVESSFGFHVIQRTE